MSTYSAADPTYVQTLPDKARRLCESSDCLEVAAQRLAALMFDEFSTSVLVRVFATVPFGRLPADIRRRVDGLAEGIGIRNALGDETPVFTLLGTRGKKQTWNDRRESLQHFGLPLVSTEFVAQITMMSRLLEQLGVGIDWLGNGDNRTNRRPAYGDTAGVFHTDDARTATDEQGRLIVPAQDFVGENGVETVFGAGGTYADGTLLAVICFVAEHITRPVAEQYLPVLLAFRASTVRAVATGRIFS